MIKEVPCMDCDGKGFIAKFSEYSVWSERCPNCGGTGIVKVPMTNADRIRAMSDEKLAEWLACPICKYASCKKTCPAILPNADPCEIQILSWLRQPAEEDT